MSIVNNCMVVNLHIGRWSGYRFDKRASEALNEENHAETGTGRVNKLLVSKDALKPVDQAANAIRTHFYSNTLPWKDNGDRLLTRKRYFDFMKRHADLVEAFNMAREDLLTHKYAAEVERAAFRMGGLFDPDDFPKVSELRQRYYVDISIDPVGTANDFRVAIDEAEQDRIRQDIEAATHARVNDAMRDAYDRVAKVVGHLSKRMEPDARFQKSTVENLDELIDLLPGLNPLDDPELDRMADRLRKELSGLDAKELRKDEALRAETKSKADDILADLGGLMKAFG